MAYTTPRTWPAGENPTAAVFNTHLRDNTVYLHDRIDSGKITITPSAPNTPTSVFVPFHFTFTSTPVVIVSAETGFPGASVTGVGGNAETTTGFTATVTRTTTTDTGLQWIAVIP